MLWRALIVLGVATVGWVVISALPAFAEGEDPSAVVTGTGPHIIWQLLFNGLVFGLLLALASVGLSLIYGTTGLSNFAHGEQVTLGAILAYFFVTDQPVSLPLLPFEFTIGLPLIPGIILAVIVSAATGWLQDSAIWAPLRRRGVGTVQQMIVSIGFSLALLNFLQWWTGGLRVRVSTDIPESVSFGPITTNWVTVTSLAVAVVALLSVAFFLQRTKLGRATRAVADNPALAAASGIKVASIIRLVWIMATALAGLGGILLALYQNGTWFRTGAALLLLMFAAVTLGGLGHAYGALVGSIIIGLAAELSSYYIGADLKYAIALGVLILVLLIRPQGILGKAERVG